jgi:hypothetical protein
VYHLTALKYRHQRFSAQSRHWALHCTGVSGVIVPYGDLQTRKASKNHLAVTLLVFGFSFPFYIGSRSSKKALETTPCVCISKAQQLFGILDQIGQ